MATKNIKSKTGFTIIEVVLVLAVAGLIFLMVFIALPALQRSQRDTQRRQALSQLHSAVTQFQTNNSTKNDNLPGVAGQTKRCVFDDTSFAYSDAEGGGDANAQFNEACKFVQQYLNSTTDDITATYFVDPDGVPYSLTIMDQGQAEPTTFDHTMYIVRRAKCNGEVTAGANVRQFAVLYKLEGASVACLDNS